MERTEAEAKLKYYQVDYGDLVYTATPIALREHAVDFRKQATAEVELNTEQRLKLLIMAVQYDTIAECRDVLGDATHLPPVEEQGNVRSMATFRNRRNAQLSPEVEVVATASGFDDEVEPEFFTMMELTQKVIKPRFKIGDPCWVADWGEDGEVVGYVPATLVGLEMYPDEIWYMVGFHDEVDGVVATTFEAVEDDEIFESMPDSKPTVSQRPVLTLVK